MQSPTFFFSLAFCFLSFFLFFFEEMVEDVQACACLAEMD